MHLITNDDFQRFLAECAIRWTDHGPDNPAFEPTAVARPHWWRTVNWDTRQIPHFVALVMDALPAWEACIIAKCHPDMASPYFRFEEDCPILGTDCLVNPLSIDDDTEVDACGHFDSFCLEQWTRYDAVQSLPIPDGFTGALRFDGNESTLVKHLITQVLLAHDPWNDLVMIPADGQLILEINHEEFLALTARDSAWLQSTVEMLSHEGFR